MAVRFLLSRWAHVLARLLAFIRAFDGGCATSDAISLGIYFVNAKVRSVKVAVDAFAFRLAGLAPPDVIGERFS